MLQFGLVSQVWRLGPLDFTHKAQFFVPNVLSPRDIVFRPDLLSGYAPKRNIWKDQERLMIIIDFPVITIYTSSKANDVRTN